MIRRWHRSRLDRSKRLEFPFSPVASDLMRLISILSATLVVAFGLGACGGDDNDAIVDTSFVYARAFNASVDSPEEIFRIGPTFLARGLPYNSITLMSAFATFNERIDIGGFLPDGSTFEIDVIEPFSFRTNFEYTIINTGFIDAPDSYVIERPRRKRPINQIFTQFAHVAPTIGKFKIYLTAPDADLSASAPVASLPYMGYTASEDIVPGEYQVRVLRSSDDELIFDSGPLQLFRDEGAPAERGGHEWFFAFTEKGGATVWPIQLVLTDGNSAFEVTGTGPTSAFRVLHADRTLGNIDALLDGDVTDPLASDLAYLEDSDRLAVPPADYTVTLTAAGQPDDVILEQLVIASPGLEETLYVLDDGETTVMQLGIDDRRPVATAGRLGFVLGAPLGEIVSLYVGNEDNVDPAEERYGSTVIRKASPPNVLGRRSLLPGTSLVSVTVWSNLDDDDPDNDMEELVFGPLPVELMGADVKTLLLLPPEAGSSEVIDPVLIDDL